MRFHHILIPLALALSLMASPVGATFWYHRGWDFDFVSGIPEGLTLSDSRIDSGDERQIREPDITSGFTLLSEPMPVCDANRPSGQVGVTVGIFTSRTSDEPSLRASFRYSLDRVHWGEWSDLGTELHEGRPVLRGFWNDEGRNPPPEIRGADSFFSGYILCERGPLWRAAREEWQETQNPVLNSLYPFLPWANTHHPEIFGESIPCVGYVQIRVEGLGPQPERSIQRLYLGTSRLLGSWYPDEPEAREQFRALRHPWDFVFIPGEAGDPLPGDVNGDSVLDVADIVTHLRLISSDLGSTGTAEEDDGITREDLDGLVEHLLNH